MMFHRLLSQHLLVSIYPHYQKAHRSVHFSWWMTKFWRRCREAV